jgi:hypothetical protein
MMITVTAYVNNQTDIAAFSVHCSESMALQTVGFLNKQFGYTVFRIR